MSWGDGHEAPDPYADEANLWPWFTPRRIAIATFLGGLLGGIIRGWS